MTLSVVLKHPSPIRALPRRGRAERQGYEFLTTPVTIPAGDPPALDPSPRDGDPWFPDSGIRLHDGAYWSPLPILPRVRPWRLRGALGTIEREEAGDAIRACEVALDHLQGAGSMHAVELMVEGGIVPYVQRWYASRLDAIPSEDARALAALT